MNEQWVVDKIQEASSTADSLVKIDPDSADISFMIGVSHGGGEAPKWGNISGDINDQDDLRTELNGKIDKNPGSPNMVFGCDTGGVFVDVEDA